MPPPPIVLQDLEFRQLIERVKLRSPIEVSVGERVTGLRQRGALHWACCPFHDEKTASFAVDPRRGTWRCFGACGEGGDVLSFVQRFDGLTFLETLRLLANQCGEELPERSVRSRAAGSEAALQARYELLSWAEEVYCGNLRAAVGERARAYLAARGLDDSVVAAFGLGWAEEGGQALVERAGREKKPLDWLTEAGLVRRSESGRPYDFFRGRLMIPIRDRLGRVVGFGARLVAEAQGPKYVNTPETPLFHKGRVIYALDVASRSIRSSHRMLIVEGYTDVLAAHQAGWTGAVAVLGTVTTDDHAALIRRSGARSVVLVFDADGAGRKATLRALAGLLKLPVELRVAVLPEGSDPGDLLVSKEGAAEFSRRIEGASEWFDWCLEGLAERRGADLANGVEDLFQLLVQLQRPIERSSRLGEMARFLALPEADVRAQWDAFVRARRPAARPAPALPATSGAVPSSSGSSRSGPRPLSRTLERRLLRAHELLVGALLTDNSLVPLYSHLVESCPEGDTRVIFEKLLQLYEEDDSGSPLDASHLMTALGEHAARERVVRLQSAAEEAESAAVLARDQVAWLEKMRAESEVESLKGALDAGGDDAAALERMHEELRTGRVPTSKAPARSP